MPRRSGRNSDTNSYDEELDNQAAGPVIQVARPSGRDDFDGDENLVDMDCVSGSMREIFGE